MSKYGTPIWPTDEWLDKWMDDYLDKHPDERITDFAALRQDALDAWWLNEIEHDRATPDDLTPEQEKASQAVRKGARAVNAYGKEVKRVRKPNEAKRELVQAVAEAMAPYGGTVTNAERTVDFTWQGKAYTWTLTEHRPPKK
jgi:hypothetical protein